jgi:hypothetical protein
MGLNFSGNGDGSPSAKRSKTSIVLPGNYLLINPECAVPPPPTKTPQFIGKKWLNDTVEVILKSYFLKEPDDGTLRLAPMGLIRCSRGGKTRALREIAAVLKNQLPMTAVISVSFNDVSPIISSEQADPLQALCVRIAYATYSDKETVDFDTFRQGVEVSEKDVLNWLKLTPAILLVDELNSIQAFSMSNEALASPISAFLKKNFLLSANRYFIFSSHIVDTSVKLTQFMDSSLSNRHVRIKQLPIVHSVKEARVAFGTQHKITAADIAFFGNIPGLLWLKLFDNNPLSEKREQCIKQCKKSNLVSEKSVLELLESFITGRTDQIMEPLHSLMNTVESNQLIWIPFHMTDVLFSFAKVTGVEKSTGKYLRTICKCFDGFQAAKSGSGDGWEMLFIIALLIRIKTGLFYKEVCPYFDEMPAECTFSYNQHCNARPLGLKKNYSQITEVSEYLSCIPISHPGSHIAVYYPQHSSFKTYDIFVCVFEGGESHRLRIPAEGGETTSAQSSPWSRLSHPCPRRPYKANKNAKWMDMHWRGEIEWFLRSGRCVLDTQILEDSFEHIVSPSYANIAFDDSYKIVSQISKELHLLSITLLIILLLWPDIFYNNATTSLLRRSVAKKRRAISFLLLVISFNKTSRVARVW